MLFVLKKNRKTWFLDGSVSSDHHQPVYAPPRVSYQGGGGGTWPGQLGVRGGGTEERRWEYVFTYLRVVPRKVHTLYILSMHIIYLQVWKNKRFRPGGSLHVYIVLYLIYTPQYIYKMQTEERGAEDTYRYFPATASDSSRSGHSPRALKLAQFWFYRCHAEWRWLCSLLPRTCWGVNTCVAGAVEDHQSLGTRLTTVHAFSGTN